MGYVIERNGDKLDRFYDSPQEAVAHYNLYADWYKLEKVRLLEVAVVKVLATSDQEEALREGLTVTEIKVRA
jgi:hypothetical protein